MEMQTAAPSTPPKISMAMLRELKAALPDDDDYEVVPPKAEATRIDAAAANSAATITPEQARAKIEAVNRAADAGQHDVVQASLNEKLSEADSAVMSEAAREYAKQDLAGEAVATITPEQARAKIEAVNRAADAGQHDVVQASLNEKLSEADSAVMSEAAREYAKQDLAGEAVAPSVRTDGPPAKVLKLRPAGAAGTAPEGTGTPKTETVTAADYAAKAVAAIAASGLGAAAAATASARSATSQPTQAAKPQQGTIHLNPSVTRGEPKVAAPRASPRAKNRAEARAKAGNDEGMDRMATPAERALMLGFRPFASMFGKKPKSVGLSNEMLGQWEQGIAAASLKDASLSAADAHSALTNTPKDALKGDVESAANKAADAVAKFEKATQSANLIRDPLAKEQALTNVKSAAEQFTKTLEGGKEKFGDMVNFDAMMKQMKEMADKIAEMMAKVAEAIQSIVPGPKR